MSSCGVLRSFFFSLEHTARSAARGCGQVHKDISNGCILSIGKEIRTNEQKRHNHLLQTQQPKTLPTNRQLATLQNHLRKEIQPLHRKATPTKHRNMLPLWTHQRNHGKIHTADLLIKKTQTPRKIQNGHPTQQKIQHTTLLHDQLSTQIRRNSIPQKSNSKLFRRHRRQQPHRTKTILHRMSRNFMDTRKTNSIRRKPTLLKRNMPLMSRQRSPRPRDRIPTTRSLKACTHQAHYMCAMRPRTLLDRKTATSKLKSSKIPVGNTDRDPQGKSKMETQTYIDIAFCNKEKKRTAWEVHYKKIQHPITEQRGTLRTAKCYNCNKQMMIRRYSTFPWWNAWIGFNRRNCE